MVWNKSNAGQGSFYRSKHELIGVFKNDSAPHVNNFGLGAKGRYRSNVLDCPSFNCLHPARRGDAASPIELLLTLCMQGDQGVDQRFSHPATKLQSSLKA